MPAFLRKESEVFRGMPRRDDFGRALRGEAEIRFHAVFLFGFAEARRNVLWNNTRARRQPTSAPNFGFPESSGSLSTPWGMSAQKTSQNQIAPIRNHGIGMEIMGKDFDDVFLHRVEVASGPGGTRMIGRD